MKWDFKLWLSFALKAIIVNVLTFAVLVPPIVITLLRTVGSFDPYRFEPQFWIPFFTFIVAGLLTSALLTLWVYRRLFAPIEGLSQALETVASGNFSVQLPENYRAAPICRMNRNFNKMVRELNSIKVLQSDFIQDVSHELKTPLAAIEGYALLLDQDELPAQSREYVRKIAESSRQLSRMTGNILKLSRLEKQEIVADKEVFPLDEQLREAFLALEPLWAKKNLDIEIDLPVLEYFGNRELLWQVWTNILGNAIKFTPEKGQISLSARETADSILVIIKDTGIGMTGEVRAHIFEKFYQGEPSRSGEGSGLGLALAKKIVELSGGSIRAESCPGEGSAFFVTLPQGRGD